MDEGLYEDAIALFAVLDGYKETADYMHKARYQMALDLKVKGDTASAAVVFAQIPDYQDAAALRDECLYVLALSALEEGETEEAAAYLSDIGDYMNARDLYLETVYNLGLEWMAAGQYARAAEEFEKAGNYSDAKAQAEACFDAYYLDSYEQAVNAYAEKDYQAVIEALNGLDLRYLPDKFEELDKIYPESVYEYAEMLYKDKRPYEALPYYEMIPEYRDVESKKLSRTCYRLMGKWVSQKGAEMEFRRDGTCVIEGTEYCYYATQYAIFLGQTPEFDDMEYVFNILKCREDVLDLKNEDRNMIYRMSPGE